MRRAVTLWLCYDEDSHESNEDSLQTAAFFTSAYI